MGEHKDIIDYLDSSDEEFEDYESEFIEYTQRFINEYGEDKLGGWQKEAIHGLYKQYFGR